MTANHRIMTQTLKAQATMFRLAEREHGLTLKAISLDTKIPYETLRSWKGNKGAQAMMPVWSISALAGVIPDELLSLLVDAGDRHLVHNDDDDELDDTADVADEYARAVRRARHPKSPGGCEIISLEEEQINRIGRKLKRRAA